MKKTVILWLCMMVITIMTGCQMIKIEEGNRTPLEYTIVENNEIPEEAASLIEEKKATEFQMTYQRGEDLYLIRGYGKQMSGGYSISVEELGWTSQAVFFRTQLIGPSDEKVVLSPPSYPYIVVKTEYRKESVIFE